MVIFDSVGSVAALTPFGNVISVTSFPSLDNTGELLFIIDAKGKTIHAVEYSIDWYQNELKKEGGWSLEMVDAKNPCSGASNWKASTHIDGGTPGKSNSVTGINPDETKPALLRAFAQNETTVSLVFNEPLDSLKAVGGSYVIDNGLTLTSVIAEGPLFNRIHITLSTPISRGKIYPLEVRNITDCSGNVIGEKNKASFGIAEPADSSDLVINEILFNPPPNGVDYVEIYNRSSKIIEVNKLYLANRNSSNNISSVQQLSVDNRLLFPGEFLLLTTDISVVKSQFITLDPDALVQVNSLPSYPNDNGNVILLNSQGDIIDEVSYSDKWHFELITNSKGVAL